MIIISLRNLFDRYAEKLNTSNEEIDDELKKDFDDLLYQFIDLDENYTNLEFEYEQLRHIYNDILNLNKSLEKELKNLQIQHQDMLEQYQHINNNNISLTEENLLTNNENEELIKQLDQTRENAESLKDKLDKSQSEINMLMKDKQSYLHVLEKLSLLLNENDDTLSTYAVTFDIEKSPYYELLKESELFDSEWYTNTYLNNNEDAIAHYLTEGYKKGYNPSPTFDNDWYMKEHPQIKKNNMNPLVYHILEGNEKGYITRSDVSIKDTQKYRILQESKIIDEVWYRQEHDLDKDVDVIEHYLQIGYKSKFNPNKNFNFKSFQQEYDSKNPIVDYLMDNSLKTEEDVLYDIKPDLSWDDSVLYRLIDESGLFDAKWYQETYNVNGDAIVDFINNHETKLANATFDLHKYDAEEKVAENILENYFIQEAVNSFDEEFDCSTPLRLDMADSVEYRIIDEDNLFDEEYYLLLNPDVRTAGVNPLVHYLSYGFLESRNPNSYFDVDTYFEGHPEILHKENPLVHYIISGKTRIIPRTDKEEPISDIDKQEYVLVKGSQYFDEQWYLEENKDVKALGVDPVEHFITNGYREYRNPNSEFDLTYYSSTHPEYINYSSNPFIYYLCEDTKKEDINPLSSKKIYTDKFNENYALLKNSRFFDAEYYKKVNPNVKDNDPIKYYLLEGFREEYCTSKYFNPAWYLECHRDVKLAEVDPLIHYITTGYKENRQIRREKLNLENTKYFDEDTCEYYDVIYDSYLFDEQYYYTQKPELELNDLDPILHYIVHGVDEGLDPNPYFSTEEYLNYHGDVNSKNINPLYHYITAGIDENRQIHVSGYEDVSKRYSLNQSKYILEKLQEKVSIIIPIYNAYDETKNCIRSVLENTHIDYELILINDCSTDIRIKELLHELEPLNNVEIIENESNQGFVKNVNLGMRISQNDVVLLNSDTVVTPHWLSKLVFKAYTDRKIATVTPFSNSSDISIEQLGLNTDQLFLNKNAYQVDKLSSDENIEAPTGNGFCLFIKRDAINDIGYFDESFGRGYGEETDFTYKAYKKGWKNIRCDNVFVYHRRHASFSKKKSLQLKENNNKILQSKYPLLSDTWRTFIKSDVVNNSITNIKDHVIAYRNSERILYVTELEDDVPVLNADFYSLKVKYDCYVLTINETQINLFALCPNNEFSVILKYNVNLENYLDDLYKIYFNVLSTLKIDLLYVNYIKYFYQPNRSDYSLFMEMISPMEIEVLYSATLAKKDITELVEEKLNPQHSFEELVEAKSNYIDFNNKKTVVYTAFTGNYDNLIDLTYRNPEFDYICFTDNPNLKSDFWDIRIMEESDLDNVRKARRYKILAHEYLPEYDYSIWIDSNFDVFGNMIDYIHKYSKNNKLLAIKHDLRDCIYDEAIACIESEKDDEIVIEEQMKHYRNENYPEHNGLVASGIILRAHNDEDVIEVMKTWYDEVVNYSRRDQLSFNYACWKNNFEYDESDIFYFKNSYFQRYYHSNTITFNMEFDVKQTESILNAFDETTTIIIPIYNAYEETKSCIESVFKHTSIPFELLLINDCSTDMRIKGLLEEYALMDNVRVIHNAQNQGFVKNVNMGFYNSKGDVVLLNSDTEVTPKWLSKLKLSAYSDKDIATVTPVSNNAGAFSVPDLNTDNPIDMSLGIEGMSNVIEKIPNIHLLQTPTGNGFCMYIKRASLFSVGFFDEIFGRGYCEENDFCMRLSEAGWRNVIDPSIYIYHKHNVSFSTEKEQLLENNRIILNEKHPSYKSKVSTFVNSLTYEKTRNEIYKALNSSNDLNKKNILYVIHQGSGGTLHTSIELMRNIDKSMKTYILAAGIKDIKLLEYKSNDEYVHESDDDNEFKENLNLIASWKVDPYYTIKTPFIPDFQRIYLNVLTTLKIDIVHIRHLIRHSFDMPYIAKKLGIPVILSFHDFYYVCPSHTLVDSEGVYCGGHCTPIADHTNKSQCVMSVGLKPPILKTFVQTWREYVSDMLKQCSAFVTTSQSAYDIYTEFYPELKERTFEIIPHGRDLQTPEAINRKSNNPDDDKIRIVIPGHINVSKGGELIKSIKNMDSDDKLELHFFGSYDERLKLENYGIYHGYYKRSEFCKEIHEINPHFIAILSIWPETYCHTLTESWSCGIPVLSLDIGALGERIHKHGGGFFLDSNPSKAYDEIIEIANDSDRYNKALDEITRIKFKSTSQMSDEYEELYFKYLN